jgi:SAM-dependent methyltransferase
MPSTLRWYIGNARYLAAIVFHLAGVHKRTCNICDYTGHFRAAGLPPRYDAQCPNCGSLERHRQLFFWFKDNKQLIAKSKILHFAAEPILRRYLKQTATSDQSADLTPGAGDVVLNVEAIDLPSASVDMVICNHVLEHVDDRKALSEIFRILTPSGVAVLSFPYVDGWEETYENPAIVSPRDRLLHYGQADHVRYFGHDVRRRITDAGFRLDEITATEPLVSRHALRRGVKIFIATKPAPV